MTAPHCFSYSQPACSLPSISRSFQPRFALDVEILIMIEIGFAEPDIVPALPFPSALSCAVELYCGGAVFLREA